MSEKHLVNKPAGIFSAFTVLSRILGLVRDMLAAAIFGTGMVWDSFVAAFTIPNLARRIFGEGAISSAFVPVFSEHLHKKGQKEGWNIANITVTLLGTFLVVFTLVVVAVLLFIGKFLPMSPKTYLIVRLVSIMFPYVIFICLAGLFMGILNTFHHLAIPGLAPAVFNLVLILAMVFLLFVPGLPPQSQIIILAVFVIIGGIIEFLMHLPVLKNKGMQYRFTWDFQHPAVRKIIALMGPMVIGLGITQINIIVDRILALWLRPGALSTLYFGDRLMQFPLGIFGVALALASFSLMSKQAAREDVSAFKDTLNYSLRLAFYIALPAATGLIILRFPIIKLIFERRAFTPSATANCARVVLCYSLGLFAYIGTQIVTKAYYAMQDTKTPVKIGAMIVGLNLVLNLMLMWPLKEAGLALATAICAFINMSILLYILSGRIRGINFNEIFRSGTRSVLSALAMGGFLWIGFSFLTGEKSIFLRIFSLGCVIFTGLFVYIGTSIILGAREPKEIIGNWRKR